MTPPSSYTEYKVVGGDGRLRMAGSPQIVSWPGTCVDQLAEPSLRNGRRFLRHAEIFSGTTSSIAVAHAINTNADEHGPPAPVVPPLVSGRLFLGGLLLSRARLRFAGLPL